MGLRVTKREEFLKGRIEFVSILARCDWTEGGARCGDAGSRCARFASAASRCGTRAADSESSRAGPGGDPSPHASA